MRKIIMAASLVIGLGLIVLFLVFLSGKKVDSALNLENKYLRLNRAKNAVQPELSMPNNWGQNFEPRRIAHAGGGIEGRTYTNSIEALDANLKKGFSFFEIDFSFTADGKLACVHGWGENTESLLKTEIDAPLALADFRRLVEEKADYQVCDLERLAEWFGRHPSAFLVTDVKDDNSRALSLIARDFPEHANRVIPQVYQPEEFDLAKGLGYNNIIWTLYRYTGTNDNVIRRVAEMEGLAAVTMNKETAVSGLPLRLKQMGIPTYVHTVNSQAEKDDFINQKNISEIYTDFLSPLEIK